MQQSQGGQELAVKVTFRLTDDECVGLNALAAALRRTASSLIREAIQDHFSVWEKQVKLLDQAKQPQDKAQ